MGAEKARVPEPSHATADGTFSNIFDPHSFLNASMSTATFLAFDSAEISQKAAAAVEKRPGKESRMEQTHQSHANRH